MAYRNDVAVSNLQQKPICGESKLSGRRSQQSSLGRCLQDDTLGSPRMTALPVGTFLGGGKFRVENVASGRKFGRFSEKTLVFDKQGRKTVQRLCANLHFTDGWEPQPRADETWAMTKIPAIVLIRLMQGLDESQEAVAKELCAAFSIAMDCKQVTCMNVLVRRRGDGAGGFLVDKFSLFYPFAAPPGSYKNGVWNLLDGFSLRTGVFNGGIHQARRALQSMPKGTDMQIDAYEDCIYWKCAAASDVSDRDKLERIKERMMDMMDAAEAVGASLTASFDPAKTTSLAFQEFQVFAEIARGLQEDKDHETRVKFVVGLPVEVYCQTTQRWELGRVVKVYPDKITAQFEINVCYDYGEVREMEARKHFTESEAHKHVRLRKDKVSP